MRYDCFTIIIKNKYVILLFFSFIILLPNIWLACVSMASQESLQWLGVAFLTYVLLYACLGSTRWFFLIFTVPVVFYPAQIFYISIYHEPLSAHIIAVLLESNSSEIFSFISFYQSILWAIAHVVFYTAFAYMLYGLYSKPIAFLGRMRWIFLGVLGFPLFIFVFFTLKTSQEFEKTLVDIQQDGLMYEKSSAVDLLQKTLPFGLLLNTYEYYIEQRQMQNAAQKFRDYSFDMVSQEKNLEPETYVLVIGETSRRDLWQMHGYQEPTNPYLSQEPNIVPFNNMLSVAASTRKSIPMMLTRKPAEMVYRFAFHEPSVITAFKQAGFRTYWLSAQQPFGQHDTTTSVYASEADIQRFVNPVGYQSQGAYDGSLVSALKDTLGEKKYPKKLIILHMLGSHFNYDHRYPEVFNFFKPSMRDMKVSDMKLKENKEFIINSYKNSILYSDFFLHQVILELKVANEKSFLLYASDHGEDLYDGDCELFGHGNKTKFNFEVSAFAWYSDKFMTGEKDKIDNLTRNKEAPINHQIIFGSMLAAASIRLDKTDPLTIFSEKAFKKPRLVDAHGLLNYDDSRIVGTCQEVVEP